MTRMGREFSLVLLGTGILTAGYFAAESPEEAQETQANDQAAERVGANRTTHRHYYGHSTLLLLHGPGYVSASPGRSPASPSVSRGGFSSVGKSFGAGSGS